MSSIKNIGNRVTLLERKVNVGNYGGINVAGGLLEVDVSNSKIKSTITKISLGSNAGGIDQGLNAISIGSNAGFFSQGNNSIAIGCNAARTLQGQISIAIGNQAASNNQATEAIAIGNQAGRENQRQGAIAIGNLCARNTQGSNAITIGTQSGRDSQGAGAIAIGAYAGSNCQGIQSIAIGFQANRGGIQPQNSIVISALATTEGVGPYVNATTQNACYIAPIRSINSTATGSLIYNPSSYEITHDSTKTFVIDHPTHDDKYLVHACLEGPEAGVYYRGEGKITNGESVEITLPEYTKNFYNFTVQITPINSRNVYGVSRVIDGKFKVLGDNGDFFWLAHGARKEIQVEPSKSDVLVRGDGPYTYISK